MIDKDEHKMMAGVMRLADRAVVGLMTPRADVEWIDIKASDAQIKDRLIGTAHSRLPVGERSPDTLIGVVQKTRVVGGGTRRNRSVTRGPTSRTSNVTLQDAAAERFAS